MPRTTDNQYIFAHTWLRELWLNDRGTFAQLSYADQRYLHAYFQPDKDWTASELIAFRRQVTWEHVGLPQSAGRAVSKLQRAVSGEEVHTPAMLMIEGRHRRAHAITVRGVARPEPDLQRLARALLQYAKDQQERGNERAA